MRNVNNNNSNNSNSGNPALMFARGIESIIADPMYCPSRTDQQEIDELRRISNKQDSRGNLFNTLFRQFANF